MMPILVKSDDVRSGRKAKVRHRQLRGLILSPLGKQMLARHARHREFESYNDNL